MTFFESGYSLYFFRVISFVWLGAKGRCFFVRYVFCRAFLARLLVVVGARVTNGRDRQATVFYVFWLNLLSKNRLSGGDGECARWLIGHVVGGFTASMGIAIEVSCVFHF